MFRGDIQTTLTSLKDCDLHTWRTVHATETNGGQTRLQGEGTGGTQRDPARDLGIKTVAFCISFTGLLDTPHGKLKEVVNS